MKKTLLAAVLLAAALMTGMSPRAEAAPCAYETIGHGTAGFETAGVAGNGQSLEFYYSEDCNRAAVSLRSYAGDIQTVSGEPVLMAVLERAVFGVRVDDPAPRRWTAISSWMSRLKTTRPSAGNFSPADLTAWEPTSSRPGCTGRRNTGTSAARPAG